MSVRFASFLMDPERRRLSCGQAVLRLTPKAFDLLWLLVEAAPRVVGKAEIHARLWPGGVVSDATLVGLVKEIRRVLGEDAGRIVRTAHRVGYALDVPVEREAAVPTGNHWLVCGERRIALAAGENIIGRDPGASAHVDHPTVSRRHARLTILATHAVLEDLGSTNGTSLRGRPVEGSVTLHSGDEFLCGELALSYQLSSAVPPTVAGRPGPRRAGG
jgi:DNA-binding winged helix-turn-helix (wHTH) protein